MKGTNLIRHYFANQGHCNDDLGSTSDYPMHGKEEGRVILLSLKTGTTPTQGWAVGIKPILTTAKECGLL